MKRILISLLVAVMAATAVAQSNSLSAYIIDDTPTNVRSAPNGNVVLKLRCDASYIVEVTTPRDGWWRLTYVEKAEEGEEIDLKKIQAKQFWVHASVLALGTRNYGGERLVLRDEPSENAKVVYAFNEEMSVTPLDVKDDWVKVSIGDGKGKHIGWIETEWLCSNPLTNCC